VCAQRNYFELNNTGLHRDQSFTDKVSPDINFVEIFFEALARNVFSQRSMLFFNMLSFWAFPYVYTERITEEQELHVLLLLGGGGASFGGLGGSSPQGPWLPQRATTTTAHSGHHLGAGLKKVVDALALHGLELLGDGRIVLTTPAEKTFMTAVASGKVLPRRTQSMELRGSDGLHCDDD